MYKFNKTTCIKKSRKIIVYHGINVIFKNIFFYFTLDECFESKI